MQEDITKKPLYEIMTEMQFLEQEIEMIEIRYSKLTNRYEKLRQETVRRMPFIEDDENFKKKVKKI